MTLTLTTLQAAEIVRRALANRTDALLPYTELVVLILPDFVPGAKPDPKPADVDFDASDPDAIAPGHNPDNLTNAQVGVADGWRLLQEEEASSNSFFHDTQWWRVDSWSDTGIWMAGTLRTKNPPDFYKL